MLNNLDESKIQKIMKEVNKGKYDNYTFVEIDRLFLKLYQFYENEGDDANRKYMYAERLIHSMKYYPNTNNYKSMLNLEIQPTKIQCSYYRMRSHVIETPILRAKYADIAWIGLQEYKLLLDAIKSYSQSFPLLLEKNLINKLIKYLIRSIHLLYNLSRNEERLKINTLNLVIDTLEDLLKKREVNWIRTIKGVFSALLAEDVKDWAGVKWSKLCILLENTIKLLAINDQLKNTFEDLLEICKIRI